MINIPFSNSTNTFKPRVLLPTLAALSFGQILSAAVINWDGDTSAIWTDGNNWVDGVAPANDTTTDIARFDIGNYTSPPFVADIGTASIAGLEFGSNSGAINAFTGTELTLGASGISAEAGANFINFDSGLAINIGAVDQSWTFNNAGNNSINGQISGSGNLLFDGTGQVSLGSNASSATFTGDVTVINGELRLPGGALSAVSTVSVGSGATMGLLNTNHFFAGLNDVAGSGGTVGMAVNNNRTMNLEGSGTFYYSGVIQNGIGSATGTMSIDIGNGSSNTTQTFAGANTFGGSLEVYSGAVLVIENSSALGSTDGNSTIINGGALHIQGDINVGAEELIVNGDGQNGGGGAGAIVNVSGNNSFAGQLSFGNVSTGTRITSQSGSLNLSNPGTIAVANARTVYLGGAGDGTLAGSLSDGSLVKDGAGTWTLTGANLTQYGTTVSAGKLVVDGSLIGITSVQSGAVLAGNGVGGTDINFLNGSALEYDFDTLGQLSASEDITIGATATLNLVGTASGLSVSDTVSIVASGTSLTGEFANATNGGTINYGIYEFSVNYTATGMDLVVTAVPEPSTYALLIGVVCLLVVVRRRQRAA